MRRILMMTILLGPLGPPGLCADAQDLDGIQISPPIEVQPAEARQAPPSPSPPEVRHAPTPEPTPRPATGLDELSPAARQPEFPPRPEMAPRRPVARPSSRETSELSIPRPNEFIRPNEHLNTTQLPETITIAPPIRPRENDRPGRAPSLPAGPDREGAPRPGPDREGAPRPGPEAGGRVVREPLASQPPSLDQGRPGLLGGLFDRRSGRPAPAGPPTRRTDRPIDPNDPAAAEALKRELGQLILQREAGRIAAVELLVVGPRVHIRAQAARPWQRWSLRRSLEELPMPSGFRSTVEVR